MRVLSIVHQQDAATGVFADELAERGAELDEWVISEAGPPDTAPHSYDAILIFGGGMHVDQESRHPWLRDEDELLRDLAERGIPMLGVCLGAQLIAKALGARVGAIPSPQIGWFDVEQTPDASSRTCRAASRASSGTATRSTFRRTPLRSRATPFACRLSAPARPRGESSSTPR